MALLCATCDQQAPKPEAIAEVTPPSRQVDQRPAASAKLRDEIARLAAEAGLPAPADPLAPGGDLRSDIDAFAGLDACVRARTPTDPLLGDAIESIGYDTLVRDACRTLEALKSKDPSRCKPILLSSLRARCESSVAIFTGKPDLCPITAMHGRISSRDPTCLARASRDERLCLGALAPDRAACEALVLGDPTRCAGNPGCVRQVARWSSLAEKATAHRPFPAHLDVDVHVLGEAPDADAWSFQLPDLVQAGAVLTRIGGGRVKVAIGSPRTSLWPEAHLATAQPKLFLELVLSPKELEKGEHLLGPAQITMDLLLPKVALLSAATAKEIGLESSRLVPEVGSPAKLELAATLLDGTKTYALKMRLETFVRDVMGAEHAGGSE